MQIYDEAIRHPEKVWLFSGGRRAGRSKALEEMRRLMGGGEPRDFGHIYVAGPTKPSTNYFYRLWVDGKEVPRD